MANMYHNENHRTFFYVDLKDNFLKIPCWTQYLNTHLFCYIITNSLDKWENSLISLRKENVRRVRCFWKHRHYICVMFIYFLTWQHHKSWLQIRTYMITKIFCCFSGSFSFYQDTLWFQKYFIIPCTCF